MALPGFLLARIADDERAYGLVVAEMGALNPPMPGIELAARILTECEAKRRIVDEASQYEPDCPGAAMADWSLRCLAAVYADHPDYRDEWRA